MIYVYFAWFKVWKLGNERNFILNEQIKTGLLWTRINSFFSSFFSLSVGLFDAMACAQSINNVFIYSNPNTQIFSLYLSLAPNECLLLLEWKKYPNQIKHWTDAQFTSARQSSITQSSDHKSIVSQMLHWMIFDGLFMPELQTITAFRMKVDRKLQKPFSTIRK